jgi:hypothetical protein
MYYDSEAVYVLSQTDALSKIAAIDNCIDVLLTSVLLSVGQATTQEYMLNDGQSIIKTIYRSPDQVIKSVSTLRMLRQQYINDVNPRQVRMVDAKNLISHRFGR